MGTHMNVAAINKRSKEVAQRLESGETPGNLAKEYEVSRMTIWRWNARGQKFLIPDKDDRDEWRDLLTSIFASRLVAAEENGDDRALVALSKSLREMNGYDHSDRLREAQLALESQKADRVIEVLAQILEVEGITGERQRLMLTGVVTELTNPKVVIGELA